MSSNYNEMVKKIGGGVESQERIKYIDIAKFISVLCVVIDHIQYFLPVNDSFMIIRVVWISFFVQVFFITTGIVSKYPKITSMKDIICFVQKKFRALIIPYIIWCFFLNMSGNHDISFFYNILLGKIENMQAVGVDSVLWFLPVLFMGNIITFFTMAVINYVKKELDIDINVIYLFAIITLLFIDREINKYLGNFLFFGLRSACCASALMFLGILLKELLYQIYLYFSIYKKMILSVVLFIIGIPLAYLNMPVLNNNGHIEYSYAIWIGMGYLGKNVLLFLIVSFFMSMAIIILSMCLEKIEMLSYWGKRSLLFMTLHIYTHSIIATHIFPWIRLYINNVEQTINVMFFLILSVLLIIIIIPFIDKYMPFLYKTI